MQIDRRRFVNMALGGGTAAALAAWFPAWAQPVSAGIASTLPTVSGNDITLRIARQTMRIDGKVSRAIGINGTVPGPLVRLKEGQTARLTVVNDLYVDSSIHWHGLILPFQMDGVPGVSFPGIKPRSTFVYEFPVRQSGTYWYHSHSGLQEQLGHYGPIVIDPAGADPIGYDREHVVVLSDHSNLSPEAIFRKLKVNPGHFNMQRQTLGGLLAGKDQPLKDRVEWGAMRMDPTDVADVNGSTYHIPRQRLWPARQLDRAVQSRRAGAAAHRQRVGDDDLQRPHPGPQDDGGAGRWPQCRADRNRRVPDRGRRNL